MPQHDSGSGGQDPFGGAKQQADNQINSEIDQLAGKIPGGEKLSQPAKEAASGALNTIEQQVESKLGNLGGLGNLFGGGGNSGGQ